MIFSKSSFIKPGAEYKREFAERNSCVIFYKELTVDARPKKAQLNICALGIGYAYINGKRVSKDLFAPPCADYNKTLWYMSYDVTEMLCHGKNTVAVICGNGFFSEDMKNGWDSTEAEWRDHPKLICEIVAEDSVILSSDSSWKCTLDTPYLMNRFRQGVTYDLRIPMPDSPFFSTQGFDQAVVDARAPRGVFRLCQAEPIREIKRFFPVSVIRRGETEAVYDFGVNMSGYAVIRVKGKEGDRVRISYSEEIYPDGTRKMNGMDLPPYYSEGEFAVETLILSGNEAVWSTIMSYYGYRYVTVQCDDPNAVLEVTGAFVYEDIEQTGSFECSDAFLNKLFECGIQATKSNFFYMPTDCPTREKYGWMNDAQSSAEQFLTNFRAEKMLIHWNTDICDALDKEKGLPGIVPTHGWGYHWGNGPVSDGSLFEQMYRVYLHTGNAEPLIGNLPYFDTYFAYLEKRCGKGNYPDFGLHDWANPQGNVQKTPLLLINGVYMVKFYRIAALAASLAGKDASRYESEALSWKNKIIADYIDENGRCKENYQTALAMLIYHEIYDELSPLAEQLKALVEESGFVHDCGMVGLRHLYHALNKCSLQDYAMKIVTARDYPCYRAWLEGGATALWEKWNVEQSKNHQMYSDVLSWLTKTACGISPSDSEETFKQVSVQPYFFDDLDHAAAKTLTPKGEVKVSWRRENGRISLSITAPENGFVRYKNAFLPKGESLFTL